MGTVQVNVYYAVRLKGKKTEYLRADTETETCANSLFPQIGYLPCWYLNRHRQKWVEIGAGPFPSGTDALMDVAAMLRTRYDVEVPREICQREGHVWAG